MLWEASTSPKNKWLKTEIQLPAGVEKGKVREKSASSLMEKEPSNLPFVASIKVLFLYLNRRIPKRV